MRLYRILERDGKYKVQSKITIWGMGWWSTVRVSPVPGVTEAKLFSTLRDAEKYIEEERKELELKWKVVVGENQ